MFINVTIISFRSSKKEKSNDVVQYSQRMSAVSVKDIGTDEITHPFMCKPILNNELNNITESLFLIIINYSFRPKESCCYEQ